MNLHPRIIQLNISATTASARSEPMAYVPPSILDAVARATAPCARARQPMRPSCFWTGFLVATAVWALAMTFLAPVIS